MDYSKNGGSLGLVYRKLVLGAALGLSALGAAAAGFVTTNEGAVDSIFSQAGFGASSIDVRFNAALSYFAPNLLDFDVDNEADALAPYLVGGKTISMFFVDHIGSCGGPGGSFIGCAVNGGWLALDSVRAAGGLGGALEAHELGHVLGLDHDGSGSNLMYPVIQGSTLLSAAQISLILGSGLVQTDALGQRYISVTPIALVPEPGAWLLMGLGLGLGALLWRRRLSR